MPVCDAIASFQTFRSLCGLSPPHHVMLGKLNRFTFSSAYFRVWFEEALPDDLPD